MRDKEEGEKEGGQVMPKHRKHTPIVSQKQQGAMGAAYAAKKGKIPMSNFGGPAKEMAKSMPKAELKRHLKESKGKNLPEKSGGWTKAGKGVLVR